MKFKSVRPIGFGFLYKKRPNGLKFWGETSHDTVQVTNFCRVYGTEGEPISWLNGAARCRLRGDKRGARDCIRRARIVRLAMLEFDRYIRSYT